MLLPHLHASIRLPALHQASCCALCWPAGVSEQLGALAVAAGCRQITCIEVNSHPWMCLSKCLVPPVLTQPELLLLLRLSRIRGSPADVRPGRPARQGRRAGQGARGGGASAGSVCRLPFAAGRPAGCSGPANAASRARPCPHRSIRVWHHSARGQVLLRGRQRSRGQHDAGLARHFAWRDLLAAQQQQVAAGRAPIWQAASLLLFQALKTLSLVLMSPFLTQEGPDRSAAIREAAARCACSGTGAIVCSLCTQPPACWPSHAPRSASRYAECDVYGLAASLATSWAVLAASSTDMQKSVAFSVLVNSAPSLQWVRPCLPTSRQAALHQAIPNQGFQRSGGARPRVAGVIARLAPRARRPPPGSLWRAQVTARRSCWRARAWCPLSWRRCACWPSDVRASLLTAGWGARAVACLVARLQASCQTAARALHTCTYCRPAPAGSRALTGGRRLPPRRCGRTNAGLC